MTEFAYRYEDVSYSVTVDAEMEIYSSRLAVELRKYRVLRHTKCGFWILTGMFSGQRFVSTTALKQFAHLNLRDARESYLARKRRQASIYQKRMERAEKAQLLVEDRFGRDWLRKHQ